MHAFYKNPGTGTIIEGISNKTVYFGIDDFIDKIVNGNNCFICGASPESTVFNNEHVIPNWMLKKFSLHGKTIDLPNGTHLKYGSYTLPCCQACNSLLGNKVETPVSNLLQLPYEQLCEQLKVPGTVNLLFTWMAIIFLKTHLKDTLLLYSKDARKDEGKIGDYYNWADLHHVHCIARLFYSNAVPDEYVLGAMLFLPAVTMKDQTNYYYTDYLPGHCLMLRAGDTAIFCVLNDSCAVNSFLESRLQKITGPLNLFQLIDFFCHIAYVSAHLKERPGYKSSIDSGKYTITTQLPEHPPEMIGQDQEKFKRGVLLRSYIENLMSKNVRNREQILMEIEEGTRQYLFDENGNFINSPLEI